MDRMRRMRIVCAVWLALGLVVAAASGCASAPTCTTSADGLAQVPIPRAPLDVPRELSKAALPEYVVEPPDILLINVQKVVPRPPFRIGTLDVLAIQVAGALPDRPIDSIYTVEPGGLINLGPPYGGVRVAGLTIPEAREALEQHLANFVREPEVVLSLAETTGLQPVSGEHIIGPDGCVTLGRYGKVFLAGVPLSEARWRIEQQLAQYLESPDVSVDVYAYNSKVFYIVTQGAGLGDGVARFPITGNETVLDAISLVSGLEAVSSKRIWVARPMPHDMGCVQILPVDWHAITALGSTETNYQLMPGDRVFIAEDRLVAMDTFVGKVISPFERMFGFTLLGTQTVSSIRFFKQRGQFGGFVPF